MTSFRMASARRASAGAPGVVALAVAVGLGVPNAGVAQGVEQPKLVVAIVIDQLRPDVLDRYADVFEGGLRRILDEGYRFTQASHAHARTSTAPGHATLATGVFPSRHGVVANSWQQRAGVVWHRMYAVEDLDSPIVGYEEEQILEGRSPRTMLRDGLADWIYDVDDDARRVSISRKDRAAIPMGGRRSEHVYWIVPELGRFVTSTHYQGDYPRWVERFNDRVMPDIVEPTTWESEVPWALRDRARPDSAVYEGDGVHTAFPHVSAEENGDDTSLAQHAFWGMDQPRADAAVVALANEAIDQLDLGQRDETDYLSISLSATDRVGHGYGPFSQEVFSTLIHLDRVLADFFAYLDAEVGAGRWVAGVSADHGVATMPEYARELGDENADRIALREVRSGLAEALNAAAVGGGNPDELAAALAREVEAREIAAGVYTHFQLTRGMPADSFAVLYRNSYYPGRAWDDLSRYGVDLRYGEGDYIGSRTGTNHETPYWYDRHVPMIFLGGNVEPGTSETPVYSVDFAPTLAALAGIPVPDDLDGRRVY